MLLACFSGILSAAPYGPKGREIQWVQPGGEKLTLRVYGDDYYARTETVDGYTVVFDEKDRAYHYATLAANGKSLKPSGVRAHRAPQDGLAKHLDLPKDQAGKIYQANRLKFMGEREELWSERVQAHRLLTSARAAGKTLPAAQAAAAMAKAAPVEGKKVGLTILAQFPNDPQTSGNDAVDFPVGRPKMVRFCNEEGYTDNGNTGSVRDYYYDQSNGKVTYVQEVTQIVTLPNPRNYYNFADYPANNQMRDAGETGLLLIADAVEVLKTENFDFTGLTVDADNNAIATNLFFAGPDSGVWAAGLWPHQWNLAAPLSVGSPAKPVFLYNYEVTNVENASPVIGTFCHENGHLLLGYPDLYSYQFNDGEGVGEHCLMGSGNYLNDGKTPAPIDAFLKDVVGWADVRTLSPTDYVTKTLPTTGNVTYRISKPGSTTESFYVENRGNGDKWAEYADDKGIMIWHIDESLEGNGNRDGTATHYGVALEQADGANDLENGANRGDSTDLFDLVFPLFSDTTSPNSKWWDGSDSSVRVKVLSRIGATTRVQFGKLPADTIILDTPNGGEVMYRQSKFTISWEANVVGNLKIELLKGGTPYITIAENAENTGSYLWEVPSSLAAGKNYTVRISTVTNAKPVNDVSDANFQITDDTFPYRNAMPYGWVKPADADGGWEVTNSVVYEGTHSLSSKTIGDGRKAAIAYTSNFKAGTLSFYMKVSSEVGYDYASFYIDGVRQTLPGATSKKGITGRTPWSFASYPVSAGNHTFMWVYTKDDSYAEGKDTAWLDGVLLPPTTQEIVVKDPGGLSLTSGDSTTVFAKQRIGDSSKTKKFTIKNTGNAALHSLNILKKGDNPDAFVVGSLGKTGLAPGESTTFTVKFAPSKPGLKSAEVRIQSNDENENPFIINVAGLALGIPEIVVFQPEATKLKDGKSKINFGYETVGQTGKTKVFTVKNTGNAPLTGLEVSKSGPARGDFSIRAIGSTKLAPGESTTFKVTFSPQKKDNREAQIHVTCNYKKAGSFDVNLSGTGAPKNLNKSALVSAADSDALLDAVAGLTASAQGGSVSSEIIDGNKYLTLTAAKPSLNDGSVLTVEVSPNLVDWYSGAKHTTVISDNESFLKVRDNTPAAPGVKRYIRLKTTRP